MKWFWFIKNELKKNSEFLLFDFNFHLGFHYFSYIEFVQYNYMLNVFIHIYKCTILYSTYLEKD